MFNLLAMFFSVVLIFFTLTLTGCDVTAEREMRRAEESLEIARGLGAEEHATDDYTEAEELLNEADEMAKNNRVQEARQLALKSKVTADDATRKTKERLAILEVEMEQIGR